MGKSDIAVIIVPIIYMGKSFPQIKDGDTAAKSALLLLLPGYTLALLLLPRNTESNQAQKEDTWVLLLLPGLTKSSWAHKEEVTFSLVGRSHFYLTFHWPGG